jgi:hypothetical protein
MPAGAAAAAVRDYYKAGRRPGRTPRAYAAPCTRPGRLPPPPPSPLLAPESLLLRVAPSPLGDGGPLLLRMCMQVLSIAPAARVRTCAAAGGPRRAGPSLRPARPPQRPRIRVVRLARFGSVVKSYSYVSKSKSGQI